MFHHCKCVQQWTTKSYHVYDLFYSQILTIAICDMQYEDVDSQMMTWNAFVKVMKKHSVQNVNFKIFMIDCAQTNFNAIIMLFGSGDPKVLMENNECTCFYHWVNNLLITTWKNDFTMYFIIHVDLLWFQKCHNINFSRSTIPNNLCLMTIT